MKKLTEIQNLMHVSKKAVNRFGNYTYRSCEAIFLEIKPLLKQLDLNLKIRDKLILIGNEKVIKSIAILEDNETKEKEYSCGFAEINTSTKGMHVAQCYGASTSYARKYALQALFLLDDAKDDIDSKDNTNKNYEMTNSQKEIANEIIAKPFFRRENFDKAFKSKATFDDIRKYYIMSEKIKQDYLLFIAEQTKNEINTNV